MPGLFDLPPLPKPTTEAEKRAALLKQDPRFLALMLSGEPGLERTGKELTEGQMQREAMADKMSQQRFEQEMAGTKELRERAQLRILEEGLRQGRFELTQDLAGRPMVYDKRTAQVRPLPMLAPQPQGGGQAPAAPPGAPLPAPGQAPRAPGRPAGAPAAGPPPGMPPATQTPLGGQAPQPGMPPGMREPSETELVTANLRKKLPGEVQKDLAALENSIGVLQKAHRAVMARPQAFGVGTELSEWTPGAALPKAVASFQNARRDPQDASARALVFQYAYKIVHELAGAQTSAFEMTRVNQFAPAPNDPPEIILQKLANAHEEAQRLLQQRYRQYLPLLQPPGGAALSRELPRAGAPTGKATGVVRIRGPSGEVATVRAEAAQKYLSQPGYEVVP